MKSLYQSCVTITIAVIVFTLALNFINGLNVFSTQVQGGFGIEDTAPDQFRYLANISNETESDLGMDDLWIVLLMGAGMGGIVIAWITRSPVIIGVYVFSVVFWASYMNAVGIISSILSVDGDISTQMVSFLFIGTVAMFFVFAGAVTGMLSGSG